MTHRVQKNGRVITLPVYVSNHITDEMIKWFVESGQALTVNAGRISEQVILPYLEQHFGVSGETVDADDMITILKMEFVMNIKSLLSERHRQLQRILEIIKKGNVTLYHFIIQVKMRYI